MIWPVVKYAPTSATKPNIANLPSFSATIFFFNHFGCYFSLEPTWMILPVVTYAPTAATKPNIAAQPLKRSASGAILK